jgi:toxin ParE1/3/4
MKLVFTYTAIEHFNEALDFLADKVSADKLNEIRDGILSTADQLIINPHLGQVEKYLEHLELGHRRIIDGNYKIIYRIEGEIIFVTDIFDCRQDPSRMRG